MVKKLINVIENKTISKKDFREYYKDNGFIEEDFDKLSRYIKEYKSDNGQDILKYVKIGYKRLDGETITFNNYVGIIQFHNRKRIQILPKITNLKEDSDNNYKETKAIVVKMLKCLKDGRSSVFDFANLDAKNIDIYELFIKLYINKTIALLNSGIKSSYVNKSDNLNVFKGKLLVKENILHNHSNKSRMYVSYDEFIQDCPENRIIKSTLKKLHSLSNDIKNQLQLAQLLQQLDFIKESYNYKSDFNRIVIDRSKKKYERIIQLSKVFLMNKSYSIFSGNNEFQSLLFPMDRLFEDYVAHHVKKEFTKYGWEVKTQVNKRYLFSKPNNKFKLKPDILISKNGRGVILDTKWKILIDNVNKNYDISQTDMYQMYAYCKKYNDESNKIKDVWLLYPITEKEIKISSFMSDDNVNVHIFFVDLNNIEGSMLDLRNRIEKL